MSPEYFKLRAPLHVCGSDGKLMKSRNYSLTDKMVLVGFGASLNHGQEQVEREQTLADCEQAIANLDPALKV